jgi:hypothetical protein
MSRRCGKCGAPVPAGASFFCNKCGARLPAEEPNLLICRMCGKTQSDPQSRFCDRCGTPVTAAVQSVPPARSAMQMKSCPHCGFENPGDSIFYCKKCGASLAGSKPQEKTPQGGSQAGLARDTAASVPPQRPGPVSRAGETQKLAPVRRQEAPRKRFRMSRKMAIGIAAVILILIAVAFGFTLISGSGMPAAGQENSTAPGLLGAALWDSLPGQTLVSNQATTVVTDIPLTPKDI